MNPAFEKNMFSELRIVVTDEKPLDLSDEKLALAVTMNENLLSETGFCFNAADLVKIAGLNISEEIYRKVKSFVPQITGKPMYPDFPSAVMAMDEAVYRMHQMCNYFSTYGIEFLFGMAVKRAWIPSDAGEVSDTEKTAEDDPLLKAKVLELVYSDNIYRNVYERILSRRERFTKPEEEMIISAMEHFEDSFLDVKIAFKENMIPVFRIIMDHSPKECRVERLHKMAQNSGDVLKCAAAYIADRDYHLHTSEKKAIVKVLESFPAEDFRENLILSRRKREKCLLVLQYTDFNTYARSLDHALAVNDLRDKTLRSWEANLKKCLKEDASMALEMCAKRPGELLRKSAWLMRSGIPIDDLREALLRNVEKLSVQTLVRINTFFADSDGAPAEKKEEYRKLADLFQTVLAERMKYMKTDLAGKKVYLEEDGYDYAMSHIEANEKSEEGGYIRSGTAYVIPENVRTIRFFTYWNDEERIDIDLHAFANDAAGNPVVHIGWNDEFKDKGLVMSGDMTDSDSAEYLDVNIDQANQAGIAFVDFVIHSFMGIPYSAIEKVLVGLMAVSEAGLEVDKKLYDPKNAFFYHELRTNATHLFYGRLDIRNRRLICLGKKEPAGLPRGTAFAGFSLKDYLVLLTQVQKAEIVTEKQDADLILKLGKPESDQEVSLIDQNYYMDK